MRQTKMYVNTKTFLDNVQKIKAYARDRGIIPVIKANAYGTYINKNIDILNNFDIVAVAIVDEAIDLRKLGYEKDILILNQPFIEELEDIEKYNLTVGLCEKSFLEKIISENRKIKVHLEIETGMNRTGLKLVELQEFTNIIKQYANITVEGIYTHLSSADCDDEYTAHQLSVFYQSLIGIETIFSTIKYIHTSASSAVLNMRDSIAKYIRPGLLMYGFEPFEGAYSKLDVKPVCKLASKISFIKEVSKGESISYSRNYIANNNMKVATVSIGYADGLRREMSNKGFLVVNKVKCPILGNVCMDSCMIDVSDVANVKVGDEAFVWDNEIQTLDDVAKCCNTINYEILSTISNRVVRCFEE